MLLENDNLEYCKTCEGLVCEDEYTLNISINLCNAVARPLLVVDDSKILLAVITFAEVFSI